MSPWPERMRRRNHPSSAPTTIRQLRSAGEVIENASGAAVSTLCPVGGEVTPEGVPVRVGKGSLASRSITAGVPARVLHRCCPFSGRAWFCGSGGKVRGGRQVATRPPECL